MEIFKIIILEGLRFILQIGFFLLIIIFVWTYFKGKFEQEFKIEKDMNSISFENSMINTITRKLVNEIDNVFIEGLARKGYKFDNKVELIDFVKENAESVRINKNIIYIVNGIPFLSIVETPTIDNLNIKGGLVFTANFGTYEYL